MPAGSPAPSAWPTRTVVASATPIGTMKHSAATLMAIWCAAADTAPSRAISSAVTMNRLPSISTVMPIGRPVRSSCPIVALRGGSKWLNSFRWAKRREFHRYSAKQLACTHIVIAEAVPSPAAPISGRPNLPKVST